MDQVNRFASLFEPVRIGPVSTPPQSTSSPVSPWSRVGSGTAHLASAGQERAIVDALLAQLDNLSASQDRFLHGSDKRGSTLRIGAVVLLEASLSFLGFGLPPPFPSWGQMLTLEGREYMRRAPGLAIFPGLAIGVAVFSFNMLGDALRDVLDQRLRRGR